MERMGTKQPLPNWVINANINQIQKGMIDSES